MVKVSVDTTSNYAQCWSIVFESLILCSTDAVLGCFQEFSGHQPFRAWMSYEFVQMDWRPCISAALSPSLI